VRRPEIYLFDEPLSNLDAALRVRMRVELKALHERLGATMIYVTHDQTEAMTLADRVVVLEAGRIEQVAPPAEIYLRPRNVFVATFVGTPAMNVVETAGGKTGVRPEDLVVSEAPAEALGQLPEVVSSRQLREELRRGVRATIEAVEPIGDRGHVHVRTGPRRLVATIEGARAFAMRAGAEVGVSARGEALHVFDEKGERVEERAMTFGS
jgi:multiple sugar transport system ATP-binding protein